MENFAEVSSRGGVRMPVDVKGDGFGRKVQGHELRALGCVI